MLIHTLKGTRIESDGQHARLHHANTRHTQAQ